MTSSPTDVRTGTGRATVTLPPTTYSAQDALDYVRDTRELRTPVERALADEVARLRALVARQADTIEAGAVAVARVTEDVRQAVTARAAEREAREALEATARTVTDLWSSLDPHGDHGGRARATVRRVAPHDLVAALDDLAEVL